MAHFYAIIAFVSITFK